MKTCTSKKIKLVSTDSKGFALFATPLGTCAIAWSPKGVMRVQLPEGSKAKTQKKIRSYVPSPVESKQPLFVKKAIAEIVRHLSGDLRDLLNIPLDFENIPPFHRKVFEALRAVKPGKTSTYADLAKKAGSPKAARAVGQAMAQNPFALIVPCHRVLGSKNNLGGFSAFGGIKVKAKLLAHEGVFPDKKVQKIKKPEKAPFFDPQEAIATLCRVDKKLGSLIKKVGPCKFEVDTLKSPFEALLEAIVYQQLTGKAAATILRRLKEALNREDIIDPHDIISASDDVMRGAGLSRAKVAALRDLALKAMNHSLPGSDELNRMDNEEIISRLTTIKGIGRWTVEMFLMFRLGRPDVLSINDYGLRKGFSILFNTNRLPTQQELAQYGERWKPYRSIASWYLWRANEVLPPLQK